MSWAKINANVNVFTQMQIFWLPKCKCKCFDSNANVLYSKNTSANAAFSNANAFEPKLGRNCAHILTCGLPLCVLVNHTYFKYNLTVICLRISTSPFISQCKNVVQNIQIKHINAQLYYAMLFYS